MLRPIVPQRKQKHVEAARHICAEVRIVLSSLRGGPPHVAYGDLAQNLRDLRTNVRARFLETVMSVSVEEPNENSATEESEKITTSIPDEILVEANETSDESANDEENDISSPSPIEQQDLADKDDDAMNDEKQKDIPVKDVNVANQVDEEEVGPYARPFLTIIMDPRAAGPHTLVALRALHRLIERGSLVPSTHVLAKQHKHGQVEGTTMSHEDYWRGTDHAVSLDPLMRGVLQCKFEQTDAGADEAVEMAIADLLALLVAIDASSHDLYEDDEIKRSSQHGHIRPETFMDAFNTVFVTRNTFVHSPALCYHFDDVLKGMVSAAFRKTWKPCGPREINTENKISPVTNSPSTSAAQLILEFLVQQLLHTPFIISGAGSGGSEAQAAHDATRILCLRLSRCCLRTGWGDLEHFHEEETSINDNADGAFVCEWNEESIVHIIQDEFCLSLLMTGQAFWSDEKDGISGSTGILSLEVLSELCSTISTLWSISALRFCLESQFEAIFSGFFQRALSLLRRRNIPTDSEDYMANIVFDSEIEIVLETLVDILHLHDRSELNKNDKKSGLGALETLFAMYDCSMNRSDVAMGLIIELCRCCGGRVKIGDNNISLLHSKSDVVLENDENIPKNIKAEIAKRRRVPARLKELCGEALIGSLQCVFGEPLGLNSSEPSNSETEQNNISHPPNQNSLRQIKNQKRIMHRGAMLFNKKSKEGIKFLINEGILPTPTSPKDLAEFLRQGIVVGLDKVAVGTYLGEAGKAPVAGKSPHDCERDWFHKETLKEYCALFRFEHQSLLDGLRMFLSSFRLPGEAQQIDRILQAFAESCGKQCLEGRELGFFSNDPKKAADAAYLLAFSLIMLNTDLHNDNIRPERKMSKNDFVKNNTNYGRDITDEGKDLPRELLESLYESIKEVELRTEGEGADGVMTVERWKDVLRGQGREATLAESPSDSNLAINDYGMNAELKDLLVESLWRPLVGSISGFWGVEDSSSSNNALDGNRKTNKLSNGSELLGSQGSRLGIDLSTTLLNGLRSVRRKDLFQTVFAKICSFSGLWDFPSGIVERTMAFSNSMERQSAVIVAINTAKDAGDDIGIQGWECIWGIVFELRDLKLLCSGRRHGLIYESDHDLLSSDTRKIWRNKLVEKGLGRRPSDAEYRNTSMSSMMGTMSRIFFGEDDSQVSNNSHRRHSGPMPSLTVHEKEKLLLWDDMDPDENDSMSEEDVSNLEHMSTSLSPGAAFERLLTLESSTSSQEERSYSDNSLALSSRTARIRSRLSCACDFSTLTSGSRFLSLKGIQDLLSSLIEMIRQNRVHSYGMKLNQEETLDDHMIVLSPASEALAEILICEIAIRNRDRIGPVWSNVLSLHYYERLGKANSINENSEEELMKALSNPGIEKCATGLLRICCWMKNRSEVSDEILKSLHLLYPPGCKKTFVCNQMDKHLAESMWRICCEAENLQHLGPAAWGALLGLVQWCASIGGAVVMSGSRRGGLGEDDPSLQAFRVINLLLHAKELKNVVPLNIVDCIVALVESGENGYCAKLSVAGLDLLYVLHSRLEPLLGEGITMWWACWFKILRGLADAARDSTFMVSFCSDTSFISWLSIHAY